MKHRVHGRTRLGVCGHQDDRGLVLHLGNGLEQLDTAGARHLDIGHDQIESFRSKPGQRLRPVAGFDHLVALLAEDMSQELPGQVIIIYHQRARRAHLACHASVFSSARKGTGLAMR